MLMNHSDGLCFKMKPQRLLGVHPLNLFSFASHSQSLSFRWSHGLKENISWPPLQLGGIS